MQFIIGSGCYFLKDITGIKPIRKMSWCKFVILNPYGYSSLNRFIGNSSSVSAGSFLLFESFQKLSTQQKIIANTCKNRYLNLWSKVRHLQSQSCNHLYMGLVINLSVCRIGAVVRFRTLEIHIWKIWSIIFIRILNSQKHQLSGKQNLTR